MIGQWLEELLRIKLLKNKKGEATAIVLMFVMFFVYIFLPIFAAVVEQAIFRLKAVEIREAVEIASIATYTALNTGLLSKTNVTYTDAKLESTFKRFLADNMHINSDLTPKSTGSVIAGAISVIGNKPVIIPVGGTCPDGSTATNPVVHVSLIVPIKPILYQYTILQLLGVSTINCYIDYNTEIILDNY